MGVNNGGQGYNKVGIRSLCSLISLYKNESSRVVYNDIETYVFFFERLQEFSKSLCFFYSFMR